MPNIGNQYFPSTSYTNGQPYIPVLHNTTRPTPPVVGPSGTTGYGPMSQPPASAWVQLEKPNIGNQYYRGAQYNNLLYVPYPGGVTNQWT